MKMEGLLKVTPSELTSLADNFKSELSATKSNAEEMVTLIKAIGAGVWTGDAADSYKRQFENLHNDFEEVANIIQNFIDKIIQIADEYKNTEEKNSSIATELKIDPII